MESIGILCLSAALLLISCSASAAEAFQPNYDESKIPPYALPDLLTTQSGERVSDAATWTEKRRPEIFDLFRTQVYGKTPTRKLEGIHYETLSVEDNALSGKARRKEVVIYFSADEAGPQMTLMLYAPKGLNSPAPAFLGLNFFGNQVVEPDPTIMLNTSWHLDKDDICMDNHATEKSRGFQEHRWQAEKIIERGYALATACYDDIDPDYDDGFQNGIHPLFYKAGQTRPEADEWGSIGAWAWGLSRALDYLETEPTVDAKRVAVVGHSRLGKTALWAAAQDERFAMAISNESGCGGAALSKRIYGETVGSINTAFPHWFCGNFKKYNQNESALPVDQHMLIALIAPRPVYVASAEGDQWADPKGEFLSALHAEPAYALFGEKGVGVADMPAVNTPVGDCIAYHCRTGEHDQTLYDWEQYLSFADKHLKAE